MVKFDIDVFKFLTSEHFRVLTAIEMGMKNHELVPTPLIESISNMKRGNCYSIITDLHKHKLVVHNSLPYDGYTLTYRGYDYLAIRAFVQKGTIVAIGKQIGIGKESDVYEAFDEDKNKIVLKLHRLGRTSFRKVKEKRDYLRKGQSVNSWLYLSRLSALKEFSFMKVLSARKFPVPKAIDVCRHAILMSYIKGYPMYHIKKICKPAILYNKCMQLIVELAKNGLIHCDFNEFNLIVDDKYNLTLIDFPQMISINHKQSIEYFNRDVKCIRNFFDKKHDYTNAQYPVLDENFINSQVENHLDSIVQASGFESFDVESNLQDVDAIDAMDAKMDEISENMNEKVKNETEEKNDTQEQSKDAMTSNYNSNALEQLRKDNDTAKCKDIETSTHEKDEKREDKTADATENISETEDVGDAGDAEDAGTESEAEDEKARWEKKKLEKRRKFEERRAIKQRFLAKQSEMLSRNDETLKAEGNENEDGKQFMSAEEIRKRLKKKQKSDERKQRHRRARKTGQKNKMNQSLKKELKNTDVWGI